MFTSAGRALTALSGVSLAAATRLMLTTSSVTSTTEMLHRFDTLLDASRKELSQEAASPQAAGASARRIAMLVTAQMAPSGNGDGSKRSHGELRRRRWADAKKKGRILQEELKASIGPVEIDCIDCSRDDHEALLAAVERAHCIWVSGGNTFFLWHHMCNSGMDAIVRRRVGQGALYVGCSAGAIVAGRSIETAFWKGWDDPTVVDTDWSDPEKLRVLGLAPCCFFPHYEQQWADVVDSRRGSLLVRGPDAVGSEVICLAETSAYIIDGTRVERMMKEELPTGAEAVLVD